MKYIRDLMPDHWAVTLRTGRINLGLDVASTTKKKSNPSSLTVMEFFEGIYWQRLVVRFKTAELDTIIGILNYVLESIPKNQLGILLVDKSNERFAVRQIRKKMFGKIRVLGFAGNNAVTYLGEKSDAKTAMGSAYIGALEDGVMAMPPAKWLEADHRLVTRNGSRFDADVDAGGNHADTFDSGKLALWAFIFKGILSGKWKPAAISTFDPALKKGASARDQQLAQLMRNRRQFRKRYLSS